MPAAAQRGHDTLATSSVATEPVGLVIVMRTPAGRGRGGARLAAGLPSVGKTARLFRRPSDTRDLFDDAVGQFGQRDSYLVQVARVQ